ncbi:MAG: DUF2244 domain-containing protein [Betaproteobacteria bacterium]
MNGETVESETVFLNWRPNRALSPNGRWLWLGLIAGAIFLVAAGAAALGAWLVLPFAGAELLLVGLAFNVVGRHDDDYEVLRISDQDFSWERNDRGRLSTLRGNRAWVQVIGEPNAGKFELCLSYAGKRVAIGCVLSDEQRRALSRKLLRKLGNR